MDPVVNLFRQRALSSSMDAASFTFDFSLLSADVYLQKECCSSYPQFAYDFRCISCARNGGDCRFYNRMLRHKNDPTTYRRLLISDLNRNPQFKEHLRKFYRKGGIPNFCFGEKSERRQGMYQIAAYTLQCLSHQYLKIVESEREAASLQTAENGVLFSFSSSTQVCDICGFSILNLHFACLECGLELCVSCFKELKTNGSFPDFRQEDCFRRKHAADMFQLASYQISLDEYEKLSNLMSEFFLKYKIKLDGAVCNGNHGRMFDQEEKCYCPRRSPSTEIAIKQICVIKDQFDDDAYNIFKAHMAAHNPIIVENVDKHPLYNKSLWTLRAFKKIVNDGNAVVLDSRTFSINKPCTMKKFWTKFNSIVEGEKLLKVKDFPEQNSFAEVARHHYENFYQILPFSDYTHIDREMSGRGRLNILNMLNDSDTKPDPGPKAYICFGLYSDINLASTPLHLDVSDAVNYLAVVEPPEELISDEIFQIVLERLDIENIHGEERARCLKNPSRAGALWKVFHPDDNENIRKAIMEWNNIQTLDWDSDPIHNQDFVITPEVVRFFEKLGIHCKMFIQNEGDVVFIPSGVAHQVQNIFSCIKIAEDFVSLEGIDETVKVSEEVRRLRCKRDLTQVSTIIHAACSAACSVLSKKSNCRITSSLKA